MSAVKYVCPIEGCGAKGFDEPGGTKMTCRHHGERMVQHEAGAHIPTERYRKPVAVTEAGVVILEKPKDVADDPEAIERSELEARYLNATSSSADRRWGMARLRSNVEHEEARAAERKAALEAAQAEDEAEAAATAELMAGSGDGDQSDSNDVNQDQDKEEAPA